MEKLGGQIGLNNLMKKMGAKIVCKNCVKNGVKKKGGNFFEIIGLKSCTVYSVNCRVFSVQYTVYSVQCTV